MGEEPEFQGAIERAVAWKADAWDSAQNAVLERALFSGEAAASRVRRAASRRAGRRSASASAEARVEKSTEGSSKLDWRATAKSGSRS